MGLGSKCDVKASVNQHESAVRLDPSQRGLHKLQQCSGRQVLLANLDPVDTLAGIRLDAVQHVSPATQTVCNVVVPHTTTPSCSHRATMLITFD